jgi:pilus assembly protein TadC
MTRVPKERYGPKRREKIRAWRELHLGSSSTYVIYVIKSRMVR